MRARLTFDWQQIPVLLRGENESVHAWVQDWQAGRILFHTSIIVCGSALYGAATGFWRDPLQAVYTAMKFPLLILLTTLGTALLNGMLAPLLGLNLRFRQSLLAVLMSFAIACAILGSLSPIIFYLAWNTPPVSESASAGSAHSVLLLSLVGSIAFAGIVANLRLVQLLRRLSESPAIARRILFAWLATNLFLGSQLSWILRPFVGSPGLPVQFLRPDAFNGNFYESVFLAFQRLFLT
jgi:hypothetical protein